MLRAVGRCGDEGQIDLGLLHRRKFDLCLLASFFEALGCHLVLRQVDTFLVLEGLDHPLNDLVVPVIATKVGVARGRLHFEHAVADVEDRNVEGSTTEVEHEDGLVLTVFVQAIGKGSRGWLVDDAQHVEASNCTSFFGGGALCVVEVGRHGDDRVGHGVAEVGLCITLQLLQDAS